VTDDEEEDDVGVAYLDGDAILAEVALRERSLGSSEGIAVVEGHDDVRLLRACDVNSEKIIPVGGRQRVLLGHAAAQASDLEHAIFIVDCDYEVVQGRLAMRPGLFVTTRVDLEADMIDGGALERVVSQAIPAAIDAETARVTTDAVLQRARVFAEPLARMRLVAQQEGLGLGLKARVPNYAKARVGDHDIDFEKFCVSVWSGASPRPMSRPEFISAVAALPVRDELCHGKDLLRAAGYVLHSDYNVSIPFDVLCRELRLAAVPIIDRMPLIGRIRQWEQTTGRTIFPA
jgi:hypothetical protein